MLPSLGEAVLDITADSSRLPAGLDHAHSQVQGAVGKLQGFLGGALQFAVGGIIQTAITTLSGSVGQIFDGMIKGNAEFERYNVQFGVLLGSADLAKERLAELELFGRTTPFELPEVVRADKILQAFGFHAEDTAKKFGMSGEEIRRIAGDVAAGSGASFESIATYLGKFASGATGESIMRMSELGIVTRQQMKEVGVEFDKAGALVTPVDEAMGKMLGLMKGKFGGMMDAQSGTFEGMMSNLQDWTGATLREVGKPLFDVLKDKLKDLLDFLGSPAVKEQLSALATGMSQALGWLLDQVTNLGSMIGPVVQTITGLFNSASGSGGLGDVFTQLGLIANNVFNGILVPLFEFFKGLIQSLVPVVLAGWQQIGGAIMTEVNRILPQINTLVIWFQNNLPAALDFLTGVWNNTLMPILTAAYGFISTYVIPTLGSIVSFFITNIPTAIETLAGFWNTTLLPIFNTLATFFNTYVLPVLTSLFDWLQVQIPAAIAADVGFWNNHLLPAIQAIWNFISTYLFPLFKSIVDLLDVGLQLAIQNVTREWNTKFLPAIKSISDWVNVNLMPAFNAIWKVIEDHIIPAVRWFVEGQLAKLDEGLRAVGQIIKDVTKFFEDLVKLLKDFVLPKDLTPGSPTPFENGLRGIASALREVNSIGMPAFENPGSYSMPDYEAQFQAGAELFRKPVQVVIQMDSREVGEAVFEIGGDILYSGRQRILARRA